MVYFKLAGRLKLFQRAVGPCKLFYFITFTLFLGSKLAFIFQAEVAVSRTVCRGVCQRLGYPVGMRTASKSD